MTTEDDVREAEPGYNPRLEAEHLEALDQQPVRVRLLSGELLEGVLQMCGNGCLELLDHKTGEVTLVYRHAVAAITMRAAKSRKAKKPS